MNEDYDKNNQTNGALLQNADTKILQFLVEILIKQILINASVSKNGQQDPFGHPIEMLPKSYLTSAMKIRKLKLHFNVQLYQKENIFFKPRIIQNG